LPLNNESFGCKCKIYISAYGTFNGTKTDEGGSSITLYINTSGEITYSGTSISVSETSGSYRGYATAYNTFQSCKFGYEAKPIE